MDEVRDGLGVIMDDLIIDGVGDFAAPPLSDEDREQIRQTYAKLEETAERDHALNICRLLAEIDRLRGVLARCESASHPG